MNAVPKLDVLEAQVGDGLGQLIAATQRTLAELERRRQEIDAEIAAHGRKLRTWQNVRGSLGYDKGRQLRLVRDAPPTKREAVLGFLSDYPEGDFKLVEIRRALIERGWMTGEKNDIHALEVAVIGMAERGEIHRIRKGIYTLRPQVKEADERD